MLELPTDPINFEAENWDYDQDGEGDLDVNWGLENEITSNHSSVTLSSKTSKRSFDEVDSVGDEDGHSNGTLSPISPGAHPSIIVHIPILICHHRSKTITDSLALIQLPKILQYRSSSRLSNLCFMFYFSILLPSTVAILLTATDSFHSSQSDLNGT